MNHIVITAVAANLAVALFAYSGTSAWGQNLPPQFPRGFSPERARILFGNRLAERQLLAQKKQTQKVAQAEPAKNVCKPMCDEFRTKVRQRGSMTVIVYLNVSNLPDHSRAPKEKQAAVLQARKQAIREAQDRLLERMAAHKIKNLRRSAIMPDMAMTVDAAGLEALIANPDVVRIYENKGHRVSLRQSAPLIGADQIWAKGFTGAGYSIAVLDTGVDAAHPFLFGKIIAADQACFSGSEPDTISLCPNGETVQIGPGAAA